MPCPSSPQAVDTAVSPRCSPCYRAPQGAPVLRNAPLLSFATAPQMQAPVFAGPPVSMGPGPMLRPPSGSTYAAPVLAGPLVPMDPGPMLAGPPGSSYTGAPLAGPLVPMYHGPMLAGPPVPVYAGLVRVAPSCSAYALQALTNGGASDGTFVERSTPPTGHRGAASYGKPFTFVRQQPLATARSPTYARAFHVSALGGRAPVLGGHPRAREGAADVLPENKQPSMVVRQQAAATPDDPFVVVRQQAAPTHNAPFVVPQQAAATQNAPFVVRQQAAPTQNVPFVVRQQAAATPDAPFVVVRQRADATPDAPFVVRQRAAAAQNAPLMSPAGMYSGWLAPAGSHPQEASCLQRLFGNQDLEKKDHLKVQRLIVTADKNKQDIERMLQILEGIGRYIKMPETQELEKDVKQMTAVADQLSESQRAIASDEEAVKHFHEAVVALTKAQDKQKAEIDTILLSNNVKEEHLLKENIDRIVALASKEDDNTQELKVLLRKLGVEEKKQTDKIVEKLGKSSRENREEQNKIAAAHGQKLAVLSTVVVKKVDKDEEGLDFKIDKKNGKLYKIHVMNGTVLKPAIEYFAVSPPVHSDSVSARVLLDGSIDITFEVPPIKPEAPYTISYNFTGGSDVHASKISSAGPQPANSISIGDFNTTYEVESTDASKTTRVLFHCIKKPQWDLDRLKSLFKKQ